MNGIKQIGVICLLIVFLFCSMGVSVLHHICNTSQTDNITLYPEFFPESGSSCCEGNPEDYVCNTTVEMASFDNNQNIKAAPCCVSINSFLKLDLVTIRAEKLIIGSIPTLISLYLLPLPANGVGELFLISNPFFQFFSLPRCGKRLILFLHQPKIPDHLALS